LKHFLIILFLIPLSAAFSCSSGKKETIRSRHPDNTPEIGSTEVLGGDTVAIRGYTGDHEFNTKMKLIDLEIIDCYKQFVPGGNAQEVILNLKIEIDNYGSIQFLDYNVKSDLEKKVANCVLGDVESLTFRPGNMREVDYRLVYKPVKSKKKVISRTSSKRSRMIKALPDMSIFKKCYEAALERNPHSGGSFTISFKITEKGKAVDATIVESSFQNTDVPLCVVKRLLKTYFPESDVEDKVQIKFKYGTTAPATQSIRDRKKTMDIDL